MRQVFVRDYGMIASSIAFSSFLALLPLLGMVALVFGMIAPHETVVHTVMVLARIVPGDARAFVGDWLIEAMTRDKGRGIGLALSAAISLYSATRAGRSVIAGLNVAYDIAQPRSFFHRALISLGYALLAAGLLLVAMILISAATFAEALLPANLGRAPGILLWIVSLVAATGAVALLYRHGTARPPVPWRWTLVAACFSTALWLLSTLGFGLYLTTFAAYDRTYGSIGAIVALQIWMFLSSMIFLGCGRLNIEMERHAVSPAS